MHMRLLLGLLACYLWIDYLAVPVWQSDRSLSEHVYLLAPSKPRAQINFAKQLFADEGRDADVLRLTVSAQREARHRGQTR